MKMALMLAFISFALTSISPPAVGEWRGIIPLKSSCEDVKRILNVKKCEFPTSSYEFPDSRVVVNFSTCTCCEGWRVRRGTVTSLGVYPLKKQQLEELSLDSGYERIVDEEIVGGERFVNASKGVNVYSLHGSVLEIIFYPAATDEKLRCSRRQKHNKKTTMNWLN